MDDDDLRFEDPLQGGGHHTRLEDPRHQDLGMEQLGYLNITIIIIIGIIITIITIILGIKTSGWSSLDIRSEGSIAESG